MVEKKQNRTKPPLSDYQSSRRVFMESLSSVVLKVTSQLVLEHLSLILSLKSHGAAWCTCRQNRSPSTSTFLILKVRILRKIKLVL